MCDIDPLFIMYSTQLTQLFSSVDDIMPHWSHYQSPDHYDHWLSDSSSPFTLPPLEIVLLPRFSNLVITFL